MKSLLISVSLQILLACDTDEREENAYKSVVGKPKENIPLRRTGWEDNIKWILNVIVYVPDSLTRNKD
jgi:hypothetical protein